MTGTAVMVFKKKKSIQMWPLKKDEKKIVSLENFIKEKKSTPDQVCAMMGTVVIPLLKFLS